MKINLPHLGERDICIDDSCDGSHCRVCGCHFVDWSHGGPICDTCIELPYEKVLEIEKAMKNALSSIMR